VLGDSLGDPKTHAMSGGVPLEGSNRPHSPEVAQQHRKPFRKDHQKVPGLHQYDFEIAYREGQLNVMADALSIQPLPETLRGLKEASATVFSGGLLRGHISTRVLTRTWAEGEASDIQAPFAGISYVVFGSWNLGKPLSSPT